MTFLEREHIKELKQELQKRKSGDENVINKYSKGFPEIVSLK